MKIKPNVCIAGQGFSYLPGNEYEVDDAEAVRLLDAGQASTNDASYKPKPKKPEPQTLDKKPSQPVENVDTVKEQQRAQNKDAAPEKLDPPANTPAVVSSTAIDAIKKGGK